ncbi:MAG TPA: hypothetical protein VK752_32705 [Bryobacteraceae bacterium]|nr:hypothetical protein [Bryobacteraceae bacterium]
MAQGEVPRVPPTNGSEGHRSAHVPEEAIREELARVLSSHEFRASKRSQDFLRYAVENTLNGHTDLLKERTIGIEVFGRSTSYEPSDDATVRVKAGDVRKRLGLYYAEQGAHNPVRIELPGGTYVPEFRWEISRVPAPVPEAAVAPAIETLAPKPAARLNSRLLAVAATLAISAAIAVAIWIRARPAAAIDQFWAPVLNSPSPVSLCVAYVPVFGLDRDANSKQPVRSEDFVSLTDQFVGGGDLIATSRLSSMLTRMERPYRLRVGSDVSFHDLRTSPAILVGYSYTRWKEISSQLRFFIDASRNPVGITDFGRPTQFTLPNLPPDRHTTEDYAIVSRVFHPDTHAMLVELAGITQYGTDAAADVVTNADLMAEALRGAPPNWKDKNLQLVLHVKVISGTPSSPKIVATHFW